MATFLTSFLKGSESSSQALRTRRFRTLQNYMHTFRTIPLEVTIYDKNRTIIFINDHSDTHGVEKDQIIGRDDHYNFEAAGIDTTCLEKRTKMFEAALKEKRVVRFTEKLSFPSRKKTLYYKRTFQPIFKENSDELEGICLFGSNLTAVVMSQNELKYLAYHDKLTGLRNRDAFYEQLDQSIVEAERSDSEQSMAILFCDLDNFKLVNDSLGHDMGDLVLMEAAQRMHKCLRKSDYVFRLGGDEFTIILKNINNEYDVARVAQKLNETLSQPYHINDHKLNYLTSSIGIVLFPRDGRDRESLVKKADTAMYIIKSLDKNNFQFYSEDMTAKSMRRLTMINNLRAMIAHDTFSEQLQLVYQPIVESAGKGTYRIIGCEALLRWKCPGLGAVSPVEFIPLAEESNLIDALGAWVLENSAVDITKLPASNGKPLFVSVNLSAKQIKSKQLIKQLDDLLRRNKSLKNIMQLEITETSYLEDHHQAIRHLNELKEMGFSLAIDDFGVGFASLVYLQKIPAHVIKIDRSFIGSMHDNPANKALVRAIILLGKNLGKDIIAEGVEEPTHLHFLEQEQCSKYQGYLFSKPVGLDQISQLLQKPDHYYFP